MYLEPQNQSLLAWILRLAGDSNAAVSVFVASAIVLIGVTIWRSIHHSGDRLAFAMALMLGLLIYPGSLRSYSIMLIIPILLLTRQNMLWPIPLAYGLMILGGGSFIGVASALLWLVFAVATFRAPDINSELA